MELYLVVGILIIKYYLDRTKVLYENLKRREIVMSSNRNSSSGGLGLCSVLTIVFIVLKLVGVINWSWLLVLCPLWINLILTIIILIIIAVIDSNFRNKRNKSRRIKW